MNKNNMLSINTTMSVVNNKTINISGSITKLKNFDPSRIPLWQDSIFSISLNSFGKLIIKKTFSDINDYYSAFNEINLEIRDKNGALKYTYTSNTYLLSELFNTLNETILSSNDTLTIILKSYLLSKCDKVIYKTQELTSVLYFEYINGVLIDLPTNIINAQATHDNSMVSIFGVTTPNTPINLLFNEDIIPLTSDNLGNFNYNLPKNLPIDFKLILKSPNYAPYETKVTYDLNSESLLSDSISIYGTCNGLYKLNTLRLNPYTKEINSYSHLKGLLTLKDTPLALSFKLYDKNGVLLIKKNFSNKSTSIDISKFLNKISFEIGSYLEIEALNCLLSFNNSEPKAESLLFKITESALLPVLKPTVTLNHNQLSIESPYEQCEVKILFNETIAHESVIDGKATYLLPKDLHFGTPVTVTLLYENTYSLPITVYTSYQNKNKEFIFNIDTSLLNHGTDSITEEISILKETYLTSKYALPIYFYEKGEAKLSILGDVNGDYSLYLLSESGCQYLDKFKTNEKYKISIPKSGILLLNLKNLTENKARVSLKPLGTLYRTIPTLNIRKNTFKNSFTSTTLEDFLNLLKNSSNSTSVSLIKSKFFDICLFNHDSLLDDVNSFSDLIENYLYSYISNNQKEKLENNIKKVYNNVNSDKFKQISFNLSLQEPKYIQNSIIIDGTSLPNATINVMYGNDLFKFRADDRGIFNIDITYKNSINTLKIYLESKDDSFIINEGIDLQLLKTPFSDIPEMKKELKEEILKSEELLKAPSSIKLNSSFEEILSPDNIPEEDSFLEEEIPNEEVIIPVVVDEEEATPTSEASIGTIDLSFTSTSVTTKDRLKAAMLAAKKNLLEDSDDQLQ